MISSLSDDVTKCSNKVRFVNAVIKQEITIRNRKKAELLTQLEKMGFAKFDLEKKNSKKIKKESEKQKANKNAPVDEDSDNESEDEASQEEKKEKNTGYNYLLGMPLWSLTHERVLMLFILSFDFGITCTFRFKNF